MRRGRNETFEEDAEVTSDSFILKKGNDRVLIYPDKGIVDFVHADGSVGRFRVAPEDMKKHGVSESLIERFEKEGFREFEVWNSQRIEAKDI